MKAVVLAFFRVGVLLSAMGAGAAFLTLENVQLGFILLGLIIVHLVIAMWTANKATSYTAYEECFADIVGDIMGYSLLVLALVAWFVAPFYVVIPITLMHYYMIMGFLVMMMGIALFEMMMTIRACLIALERQNPVAASGALN